MSKGTAARPSRAIFASFRNHKATTDRLRRALAPITEQLEDRRLFTGGPATPNLSAALSTSDPQHSIVLTYSTTDGAHLELEEMAPGDDNYSVVADLGSPSADTTHTYTLTSLSENSPYVFRLRADSNSQVAYASVFELTGDSTDASGNMTYTYDAPSDISVTPDGTYVGSEDVTLNADTGDDPYAVVSGPQEVVSPADPYHIFNLGGVGGETPSGGSVTDAFNSVPGWTVRIRYAVFDGPQASPYSAWQTVQIGGTSIDAPTDLHATVATGGNITLNWTAPSGNYTVSDFQIYGVTSGGAATALDDVDVSATSDTVSGSYLKYFVIANGSDNVSSDQCSLPATSGYSNYAVNPADVVAPTTPLNLSANAESLSGHAPIDLAWDNTSSNEDSFTLERTNTVNGSGDPIDFTAIATTGADQTSYSDIEPGGSGGDGWTLGATYYYRVKASNAAGSSSYSDIASVTFPA